MFVSEVPDEVQDVLPTFYVMKLIAASFVSSRSTVTHVEEDTAVLTLVKREHDVFELACEASAAHIGEVEATDVLELGFLFGLSNHGLIR